MNDLIALRSSASPALATAAGQRAQTRCLEFFVSNRRESRRRRNRPMSCQFFLLETRRRPIGHLFCATPHVTSPRA
jgi:hypothetical protein